MLIRGEQEEEEEPRLGGQCLFIIIILVIISFGREGMERRVATIAVGCLWRANFPGNAPNMILLFFLSVVSLSPRKI